MELEEILRELEILAWRPLFLLRRDLQGGLSLKPHKKCHSYKVCKRGFKVS